jgi:hypothetical protein
MIPTGIDQRRRELCVLGKHMIEVRFFSRISFDNGSSSSIDLSSGRTPHVLRYQGDHSSFTFGEILLVIA